MKKQVFISYSGRDDFQASLLQYAVERMLQEENVVAWTFQRDQSRSEKEIAQSLKERVKESVASIFLVSPDTLDSGATQWMELAYADAFDEVVCVVASSDVPGSEAEDDRRATVTFVKSV